MYFLKDITALERLVQKVMDEEQRREEEAAEDARRRSPEHAGRVDIPGYETP